MLEDFRTETSFSYSMIREPGFEYDRFWLTSGLQPARNVKIGSVEAICELVRAGLGVAILSLRAMLGNLEASALQATRLGPEGLNIPCSIVFR